MTKQIAGVAQTYFGGLFAGICLVVWAGALTAPAFAADEPERLTTVTGLESLPGEVAGVVGSGSQLRLQLRIGGQPRTLNIGDEYKDGWVLKALTDSIATLNKGPQTRLVGLNPSGSSGGPVAAEKSQVSVLGLLTPQQMAVLQREIDSGRWDGRPAWGLDQDQTNRLIAYDDQRDGAYTAWYAKNWVAGVAAMDISSRPTELDIMGSDYADYQKLSAARAQYRVANYQAEMAQPLSGPSSIYIPAGVRITEAMTSAGVSPAGVWTYGVADATGGRILSRADTPVYAGSVATSSMALTNLGVPKQ